MIAQTAIDLFMQAKALFENEDFDKAASTIDKLNALQFAYAKVEAGQHLSSRIAIAIVTYKTVPETQRLIEQLAPLASDPHYHFVLVSNSTVDLYPYADALVPGRFKRIVMGGNFGASLGRNAAAHFADAEAIVFIDDDGVTHDADIRKLVSTYDQFEAAAVRGRVVALTEGAESPRHYDKGKTVVQNLTDIEGMTIWRRSALLLEQYDPLLYGHEGAELTARLYRFFGREAFLYEPGAVLQHDYASSPAAAEIKQARMERNDRYIDLKDPDTGKIKNVFYKVKQDTTSAALLATRHRFAKFTSTAPTSITFLTTCYNGAEFLPQYIASLKAQTDEEFEVVFVDDGSTDNSAEKFIELTRGDDRFRLIRTDHIGRAAALNVAISHVETEFALIADVDDISIPQRVEWTVKAYEMWPEADAIGFNIFDNNSASRAARPLIDRPVPLEARRFFGMPCPFPGFSFRVSSFRVGFDPELKAGIDCNWLSDNFETAKLRGWYVPLGVTYYRTHDGQITASKRDIQREVSVRCVAKLHESLLGPLSDDDLSDLALFTGWSPIQNGGHWHRAKVYGDRIANQATLAGLDYAPTLVEEISRHINERHENLLKNDYNKVKKHANAATDRAAQSDALLDKKSELLDQKIEEIKRIQKLVRSKTGKLEWNRSRLKEAEAQLSKLTLSHRAKTLYFKLTLGVSALLGLGYLLPEFV